MDEKNKIDSRTIAMERTQFLSGMHRRRVSYLEVNAPGRPRLNFKLGEEKTVLGRTPENDIELAYTNISRHHASITLNGEDYVIEDMNSTNGSYLNGVKIARCTLRPNDLIQIGEVRIFYTEREELCME